jgi:ubiquinone/menaquinone biosynthesis C-methylase UbiE
MWSKLARSAGRTAFGLDPAGYDAARPGYPKEVYSILTTRCGLRPGRRIFEIGGGTGLATRELLRLGADALTIVEPDARLAHYLEDSLGRQRRKVSIVVAAFEEADLPASSFDLGVSATAFHWMNERTALRKVARLLKPGGWWAAWWNVFGDASRPTPFHRALDPLFRELPASPSSEPSNRVPFAVDQQARERALENAGTFCRTSSTIVRWSLPLDTPRLTALYATYSPISTLPARKRRWFLSELGKIANERFGGRVTLRMRTPIYTAQRT